MTFVPVAYEVEHENLSAARFHCTGAEWILIMPLNDQSKAVAARQLIDAPTSAHCNTGAQTRTALPLGETGIAAFDAQNKRA